VMSRPTLWISTSRPSGRCTEADLLRPSNPYAACKAAGDLLVLAAVSTWKLPALVTRSSNNYGPYQHPEKLIPLHVTNALEGKRLPVYGDGRNVRDWLHVEDNCRAIELVGQKGQVGEIYNIAAGNERSNLWVVDRIIEATGCDPALREFVRDRPGHDFRYAVDAGKVRALGWEPQTPLEAGLRQTVAWYQEHRDWWARVKSGEFVTYYEEQYGPAPPGSAEKGGQR